MMVAPPTSYEAIPYGCFPYPESHPDRLATVATLLGMKPRPINQSRVLELGCASGGNLIPMAQALPGSTFVGVELSAGQAATGREIIASLGMSNIELKNASILDVTADWGLFDYIIAHGVYSWVGPEVRDKLLAVCARNLAPEGVAYVSYNTYPGWHIRGMIRDMMLYQERANRVKPSLGAPVLTARERVNRGRALLNSLMEAVAHDVTPYGQLLKSELDALRHKPDWSLFHDPLEEFNQPVYFHEFVEHAARKGLRYLGEADLQAMVPTNFPPAVQRILQELSGDTIQVEQYMDFLRNRLFRQTLLCHQNISPNYQLHGEMLTGLHIASAAAPVASQATIHAAAPELYRGLHGNTLNIREPLAKAALLCLAEVWPATLLFEDLYQAARARLVAGFARIQPRGPLNSGESSYGQELHLLGQQLLGILTHTNPPLVEVHIQALPCVSTASERPEATPLARLQAARGNHVTNLRHELIELKPPELSLLRHLDGKHDHAELLQVLSAEQSPTSAPPQENDTNPLSPCHPVTLSSCHLQGHLQALARCALLIR